MIYKYRDSQRLDFFDNLMLRFTQPSALNDPAECIPKYVLGDIDNEVEQLAKRNRSELQFRYGQRAVEIEKQFKEKYRKRLLEEPEYLTSMAARVFITHMDNRIGILSLSKDPLNELLWSYYSGGHSGFVLGFDETDEFFHRRSTDRPDCGVLKDVIYTDEPLVVDVTELRLPQDVFFTKRPKWAIENEVRMVRELDRCDNRVHANPYDICLFRIPESALTSVVIGARMQPEHIDRISTTIQANPMLKHVRIMRAEYDIDIGNYVIRHSI